MAEMTPDQQKALAIAAARLRLQQGASGGNGQDGSLSADNAWRAVATGVPIVGGLLNRLDAATNATLAPVVDPLLADSFQKLPGDTWSERYDQALKIQKGKDEAFHEEHPYVDTGLQVTGGVAGTIPAVMAAPAAFGARGANLLLRSLAAGGSGAAIGGTDAAVRSDGDPAAIRQGVEWGGGLGAVGPVAAKVVGNGVRALADALRTRTAAQTAAMEPQAFGFFRRALTDDGLDAVSLPQRLAEMGPDAIPADLGPNLQKQAGALAATPGRGQEIVRSALENRSSGANARVNAAIDENLGPRVVPSEVERGIEANQLAVGPAYREAFQGAQPFDTTPIANALDADIVRLRGPAQEALRRVRGMMNEAGNGALSSDPRVMFETRQAIDGMLATEQNIKAIGALTDARQMLDDALRRAVPRIKEPDAMYAELARQNEAVSRGQQVLDSGRTAPRPSELATEVEQGANPQGMQIGPSAVPLRLSQGARAEIDRIVGTNVNDIRAMNSLIKGEGDWNRQRLATLFGQDKADRLFKVLENEKTFADTANTVTRNSESAARLAAQNELGGAGNATFGVKEAFKAGGPMGAARSIAVDKLDDIVKALMSADTGNATRESLARALVGEQREKLVQGLIKSQGMGRTPALVDPLVKSLMLNAGTARAR
ncbi:hypothetical protein QO004_000457 [Rhizobium mesoamericanum]|uniref:hypothetical protein n=1 Tax=Rhizobium mesoamericanum TaxID=1079800 RepID=UPI0027814106|nr:hypothetical protein [Rhizobium mesoamericanum]MDQ0558682.1 hypothetical protein [Rhizobium mesoamericanum]